MLEKTYLDERKTEVAMEKAELESMICKAKEEGYQEAMKWKSKYESLKKAIQSIGELCE